MARYVLSPKHLRELNRILLHSSRGNCPAFRIERYPQAGISTARKKKFFTMSALGGDRERAERLRRNLQNVRPPVPSRSAVSAVYIYSRQFQEL